MGLIPWLSFQDFIHSVRVHTSCYFQVINFSLYYFFREWKGYADGFPDTQKDGGEESISCGEEIEHPCSTSYDSYWLQVRVLLFRHVRL